MFILFYRLKSSIIIIIDFGATIIPALSIQVGSHVLPIAAWFLEHFLIFWLYEMLQAHFAFPPPQPWNWLLSPGVLVAFIR